MKWHVLHDILHKKSTRQIFVCKIMLTYLASSSNDDNNTDKFSSEFFDYFVRKMSLQVGNSLWHSGFLKTVSREEQIHQNSYVKAPWLSG